jgi:hypothetical protein
MASPYADPDIVREFATAVTTDVISDNDIQTLSTTVVDPIVDGELSGLGAPFDGTTPDIIKVIASMLCISIIFDDRYYQTAKESDWGKKKWDRAVWIIERIKSGAMRPEGLSRAKRLLVSDPAADKAATSVFVGDETTWTGRTEEKAS